MNRKNYMRTALQLLLCLCLTQTIIAQSIGSYDTTITFMGAGRKLSLYVPPTYDATNRYRLIIGLHGLGDNCANYRNGLLSLGWAVNLPNTIIVCPEASNVNADYYVPAGDEAIIQTAIDLAEQAYHIDSADIVLQGFSLGGRAALRYGLSNYSIFKGLLLTTPAIQGVKEGLNQGAYTFNYANAPHIPIYITHGGDDIFYESPIDSAYEQLVLNDGIVRYYQFPGLGHAIPPIAGILNFVQFFDTPTVHGYDLDVVKATIDLRSCTTSVPASCLVRNTGADTIHSINLDYATGGATATYAWSGTLYPFQHATLTLPPISATDGSYTLTTTVHSLDGGIADTVTANNTKTAPFQVVTKGVSLPLSEGFEGVFPPANWVQYLAGDVYSPWEADSSNKKTGIASMSAFNTILLFDNAGRREDIASPVLDLTTAVNPHLTFDVAYSYHHYTPPTLTIDTAFADTLQVLVSTDGGNTYTSVYKKGGTDLLTFSSPILNPVTVAADFITPSCSDWRTEVVDLSAFRSSSKAIIKFSYISALGGSINIDNINFSAAPVKVPQVTVLQAIVYPNPASDHVIISTGNDKLNKVVLTDVTGKIVLQTGNNNTGNIMDLSTRSLLPGMYLLQILTDSGIQITQLVISK